MTGAKTNAAGFNIKTGSNHYMIYTCNNTTKKGHITSIEIASLNQNDQSTNQVNIHWTDNL